MSKGLSDVGYGVLGKCVQNKLITCILSQSAASKGECLLLQLTPITTQGFFTFIRLRGTLTFYKDQDFSYSHPLLSTKSYVFVLDGDRLPLSTCQGSLRAPPVVCKGFNAAHGCWSGALKLISEHDCHFCHLLFPDSGLQSNCSIRVILD